MSSLYVTQTVNGDLQPVKVNGESSALEIAQDEVKVKSLEIDGTGICREPTVANQIATKRYVDDNSGGSGDMTGVDITAGDGLDISQSGTTSGDYTATLSADLKSNGGVVIESTELAVDLGASSLTGTLAVGDGGTGATTLLINGILTGNGTSAVQAESALLFESNNVYPKRSDHDAVGTALTISAGNTTVGTTVNIAGGELALEGGRGKGTGAGGDIVFKTANADSSGHTPLNDLATALTISDDLSSTFTGVVKVQYDGSNYFSTTVAANGATTLATVDALSGEVGHLTLDVDGDIILDADGGNITLQDGGSTYTPSTASDAATKSYVDTTQYSTIIAGMNYNLTGGTFSIIQLGGATRPFTTFANVGETTTMIAPFDGSLERIMFRSEEVAGVTVIGFHKATTGTEVPSVTPVVSVSVDMSGVADDTSTEFAFTSSNTFSKGDVIGFSIDPANDINDAIFTIVLKYDVTT